MSEEAKNRIDVERKTPLVITSIFLEILRAFFRNDEKYKYQDDPLTTKIAIEPSYRWNPEDCQNRPGIYIRRDTINYSSRKMGMNDLFSKNAFSGNNTHGSFVNGTTTVICISTLPAEAEIISAKALDSLKSFAPIIRRDYRFTRFDPGIIGPIGQIEESDEFWAVPISNSFEFDETWELVQDSYPLKQILTGFNVRVDTTGMENPEDC